MKFFSFYLLKKFLTKPISILTPEEKRERKQLESMVRLLTKNEREMMFKKMEEELIANKEYPLYEEGFIKIKGEENLYEKKKIPILPLIPIIEIVLFDNKIFYVGKILGGSNAFYRLYSNKGEKYEKLDYVEIGQVWYGNQEEFKLVSNDGCIHFSYEETRNCKVSLYFSDDFGVDIDKKKIIYRYYDKRTCYEVIITIDGEIEIIYKSRYG